MTHVLVNGIEVTVPTTDHGSLKEVIQELRNHYSTNSALIASIRVNGVEIDAQEESLIASVPVSQLRTIEVFTAHPREIAEETLQSLIEFSTHLESVCKDASVQLLQEPAKLELLPKLADGITTFIDALTNVKQILHVGLMPKIQILEADLLSILKDMLDYQRQKQYQNVGSLVREALVLNLSQWRADGIPTLIRSRDS